jgi:hypothetical protein
MVERLDSHSILTGDIADVDVDLTYLHHIRKRVILARQVEQKQHQLRKVRFSLFSLFEHFL